MEETQIKTIDENIQEALTKFNIADSAIAQYREEYMGLKIAGIEDRVGYTAVDTARKFIKKKRNDVANKGKELREDAIKWQKAVIAEEKRLTTQLEEIENYLEEETARIDAEKKLIKEEKERKEAERLNERISTILSYGMAFNGEYYVLGEYSLSAIEVKTFDEFTFKTFLEIIKKEYERQQAILKEQEELRRKEAEKLAEERAALEAEKALLAKAKAEQEAEAARLKKEEEARLAKAAEDARKIEEEKNAATAAIVKARASSLYSLGMSLSSGVFLFRKVTISEAALSELPADEWNKLLDTTLVQVEAEKRTIEEERKAEAARIAKEAEEKAVAELKAKQEAEEQEKLRLQKLLPDKEKLRNYADQLSALTVPEVNSAEAKAVAELMKGQHSKYAQWLYKEIEKLK